MKSEIEFIVRKKNVEKKLIIIENSHNLKLIPYYGFCDLFLYNRQQSVPMSVSFIVNENFSVISGEKDFTSITKSELFSFNKESFQFVLRNKKINIKNELSEKLLSKFSEEEIKQINFSLNKMKIKLEEDNLIYHKVIHNIKNKKNFIKLYYVVFLLILVKKLVLNQKTKTIT